jgi:23S rRNA (adenine2503-C2)-methyltransferase
MLFLFFQVCDGSISHHAVLAISLNAWRDEDRDTIMPINKKYPIASLLEIAKRYSKKTNRPVTFEYVLVEGENDSPVSVRTLGQLGGLKGSESRGPANPAVRSTS